MQLLVEFLTLLAMAQMWNLLAGYAGLVSIGQQAFIGLGAYGAVRLRRHRCGSTRCPRSRSRPASPSWSPLVTSLFAFRLRGGYFAVGTWVIAEVFRLIVLEQQAARAPGPACRSSRSATWPRRIVSR